MVLCHKNTIKGAIMKFSTKIFMALLSASVLAGCQSQPSTVTLTQLPTTDVEAVSGNQKVTVQLSSQDLRTTKEMANYAKNSQVYHVKGNPTAQALFQDTMLKNLMAKGFQVTQGITPVKVTVNVNQFGATVMQGNLRHTIKTKANIEALVKGPQGSFTKTFTASRNDEGALTADHEKIQLSLQKTYNEIAQAIYNDVEIAFAINKYK